MKRVLYVILSLVVLLGAVGCDGGLIYSPTPQEPSPSTTPPVTTTPGPQPTPIAPTSTLNVVQVSSSKSRDTSPSVSSSELEALVDGNTSFAIDLYRALGGEQKNLFFSPYSISEALAMTYGGARVNTERQMAQALHFTLPQDRLHNAFNGLDQQLASRGRDVKPEEKFRLNVANSIWGQQRYSFLPAYLDLLALNYGAGLQLLDFAEQPEQSRMTINDWVSDRTEGRIKDLLPSGSVDALTRLVLTNAIYFNASWMYPFNIGNTSNGPFHLPDGASVSVPLMKQTKAFGYTSGDNYQAVELPYSGNELSMVIVLPQSGQLQAFERSLDAGSLSGIVAGLQSKNMVLTVPKFSFDSSFGLKPTLAALGMQDAFSPGVADFSGMNGDRDLYITAVVHKSFVSVDEAGTEAAAATGVVVGVVSAPESPITVTVDRPFIFLIRDIKTGTVLFIGKVVNPGV